MTPTALVILALSLSTLGGLGWGTLEHRARVAERAQAQQAAQEASGALAACESRTVPETVQASAQGTTDALTVALGPELAEVQARVALVQGLTLDRYAEEIIERSSDRMLMADAMMVRCLAANTQGDSARGGCAKEVIEQWVDAMEADRRVEDLTATVERLRSEIEAQAACPEPSENPGAPSVEPE